MTAELVHNEFLLREIRAGQFDLIMNLLF